MLQGVGGIQWVPFLILCWCGIKVQYVNSFSWAFSCPPIDFGDWITTTTEYVVFGHPWFRRQYCNQIWFISLLVTPPWLLYLSWNSLVLCVFQFLGLLSISLGWAWALDRSWHWNVHAFFPQFLHASHLHTAFYCKKTWVCRLAHLQAEELIN